MTPITLESSAEIAWRGGRIVTGDGTSIAFLTVGSGPRVVIVHGGLGQGAEWAHIARELADRFTVVLVDRRCSGASGWSSVVGVDIEASDVLAVLDVVGPADALLGHSYGAAVALEAARAAGGQVAKLILYEPPLAVGGPVIDEATLGRWRDHVAAGEYAEVLSSFYAEPVAALGSISAEELAAYRTLPDFDMRWAASVALASVVEPGVRSVNQLDDADRYHAITIPTLLLVGSESAEHPFQDTTRALAAVMPGASVMVLPGQRHLAQLLAPGLIIDAIRSFVAQ